MLLFVRLGKVMYVKYEKSPKDPMYKFTKTGNKKKVQFGRIDCFGSLR
jgi:hypothetical protein